jgi:hypothetical protein
MRVMLVVLLILVAESKAFAGVDARGDVNATSIRMAGCKSLQAEFDRIVSSYSGDPAVQSTQRKLAAMDGAADAVLGDLAVHHSAFLNQSLARIGASDDAGDQSQRLIGAAGIVDRYGLAFAYADAVTKLDSGDRETLRKHVNLAAQALNGVIQARGRRYVQAVGADTNEIVRLSFVVEMLTSDANDNLSAAAPPLPTWMNHPKELKLLQVFAVESGRPRVAFAMARPSAAPALADVVAEYGSFAAEQADAMLRAEKYSAALACLTDAAEVANSAKQDAQAVKLCFRIAEVLEATGANGSAADELAHVRSICRDPADFARASMLRLKDLHSAERDDEVIAEAAADLNEPRCEANLPQIIYIAWLSARSQKGGDAQNWQKTFLARFPDQPLAADIYFSSATDAVSNGDFDTAARVLQFIEYRFPDYRLIAKVRALCDRLQILQQVNSPPAAGIAGGQQ